LGSQLKTAAQLIQQEIPIPVIHCTLAGFDTHSGELERLTDLYEDFSKSLNGLANDLTQSGHWDETLVFIYSDFGRTIDENASGGTDHGYSGLSMIAGGNLNKYKQYNTDEKSPNSNMTSTRVYVEWTNRNKRQTLKIQIEKKL
jgi:uncharacterized protein (DUF1501 family)